MKRAILTMFLLLILLFLPNAVHLSCPLVESCAEYDGVTCCQWFFWTETQGWVEASCPTWE